MEKIQETHNLIIELPDSGTLLPTGEAVLDTKNG